MHIESMKQSIESLSTMLNAEVAKGADACLEEMSEVADIIKDLSEAKYHCIITKEMEEAKKEEETLAKAGVDPMRYYGGHRYYMTPYTMTMPRYYNDYHYPTPRYYDGGGMSGGNGNMTGSSTGGGSRYYNDNRYSNGRYAPDGNTMRNYTINYPDMYDPANSFNNNKWRLDSKPESRYDIAKRYYTQGKMEHNKGTEEDNNAKLKLLGAFLDTATDDIVDIYDDASSTEQDMIMKKLSALVSKMK